MLAFLTIVTLIVIISALIWSRWDSAAKLSRLMLQGDALLVIAHPDDEAMFFAPFLEYAKRINVQVHILCLSTGNAAGLGRIREKELTGSAKHFGVSAQNVEIIDHPNLQDGFANDWPAETIQSFIAQYIAVVGSIRTIVTFDDRGVSDHPNHIAVCRGARGFAQHNRNVVLLELVTKSLWIKYIGALSVLLPRREASSVAIHPMHCLSSFTGMKFHASQLAWFRYLYLLFSSYSVQNEFETKYPGVARN